jgi:ribonucleoside-diphosphate reductase alpha chain
MSKTTKTKEVEILQRASVMDPEVSENSLVVLTRRYLAKDCDGKVIEDPKGMFLRIANALAAPEPIETRKRCAKEFYDIMAQNKFIPNSPTIMNAGRRLGMLSACFVLPVEDDLDSIFGSIRATALVQRAGGGTGFNFSKLRPTGSIVKSSGGTTSGPLSFIDVFSQATTAIQQGAFRRGANMGMLDVTHPDIIPFIKAKEDLSRWQNYNVSIVMTDDWMKRLEDDPKNVHEVHHKEWGIGELWKKYDETGELIVKAFSETEPIGHGWSHWTRGDTWSLICERAWQTGEPGLFFKDRANAKNPILESCGEINATNPCGEQTLHPYDSCNLGSINLTKFFITDKVSVKDPQDRIDWESLSETISTSVRFLDNVVDVNKYPLPEIEQMSRGTTRRIGLGVMGWADLLFALQVPYNSPEAFELASEVQSFISKMAAEASEDLANEKGNFGAWDTSDYGKDNRPMRNSFRTTVAPTGTISIIANCSAGIEPLFALSFKREVMPDDSGSFVVMQEHNPYWSASVKDSKIRPETQDLLLTYTSEHGSIAHIFEDHPELKDTEESQLIEDLRKIFVVAHDVGPKDHVNMQAAWQRGVDTSISKTINLSSDSEVDDVSDAYLRAYRLGCVGITVYRDGCRENKAGMKQPMKTMSTKSVKKSAPKSPSKDITDMLPATRTKIRTQFGNLHVNIVRDATDTHEIEIFAQLGKAGDLIAADIEAICRLASSVLRRGGTLSDVIEQLDGIGTTHIMPSAEGKIVSMPDALAKALRKYLKHKKNLVINSPNGKDRTESEYGVACPSCGLKLSFQEGCKKCNSCGFSAC